MLWKSPSTRPADSPTCIDTVGPHRESGTGGNAADRLRHAAAACRAASSGRRAVGLRRVAITLIIGAVSALVGWAVALTAGTKPTTVDWLVTLPASVLCPTLAALIAYTAGRVSRREATEQLWLAGTVLVATDDLAGRMAYDLATVPASLKVSSLMSKAGPRPVWVELRIGADPADRRILVLSEANSRRLRPVNELHALAWALDQSTTADPGSRRAGSVP